MYKPPKPEIDLEENVVEDVKEPKIEFDRLPWREDSKDVYFCDACNHKLKITKGLSGCCLPPIEIEGQCPKCEKTYDLIDKPKDALPN